MSELKRCFYCGDSLNGKNFTRDHVKPKCKGGKGNKRNKVDCCNTCNNEKGCLDLEEFRAAIAYRKGLLPEITFKFWGEKKEQK